MAELRHRFPIKSRGIALPQAWVQKNQSQSLTSLPKAALADAQFIQCEHGNKGARVWKTASGRQELVIWIVPLHRIFPIWHFETVCQLRQLVLVKPQLWSDPREDPCAAFYVMGNGGIRHHISNDLSAAWAQCWSYEANSDVLLRAYSRIVLDPFIKRNTTPAEEGVHVTTTARRLNQCHARMGAKISEPIFLPCPMIYEPEEQFGQNLVNLASGPEGTRYFGTPDGRADSLFVKRDRFSHENEVRLLCVGNTSPNEEPSVRAFEIDPNDLFTEISFDPRLIAFERNERESKLRTLNFKGKICQDPSYSMVLTTIYADNPKPPPTEADIIAPFQNANGVAD